MAALLDKGIQIDYSQLGVSVEDIWSLTKQCWSYGSARLPLRLGHGTDWKYQIGATKEFLSLLPNDYPTVVLTRFPLNKEQCASIKDKENVLCHLSLAPPIDGDSFDGYKDVLESVEDLPLERLFFMCRPLIGGNVKNNEKLVHSLPKGAAVGFHGLSQDNIPSIKSHEPFTEEEGLNLRKLALKRGLRVFDYFGCALWEQLKIPFWKFAQARTLSHNHCNSCRNFSICSHEISITKEQVAALVRSMGFHTEDIKIDSSKIIIKTEFPAARSEEVFLSQMLNRETFISTVARNTSGGILQMSDDIFNRWQKTGFAPVAKMVEISHRVSRLL